MERNPFFTCIRPGWVLVLAVLFVAVLTSCDSGNRSSRAAVHSCEVFTVEEMEELIGAPVDRPPRETHKEDEERGYWMSMCNYYAPEPGVSLGIMIQPFPAGQKTAQDAHDAYVESLKSGMGGEYEMAPVTGIGQIAFWNEPMKQLTVFGDAHMLLITSMMKDSSDEERLAFAKQIGTSALSRLP